MKHRARRKKRRQEKKALFEKKHGARVFNYENLQENVSSFVDKQMPQLFVEVIEQIQHAYKLREELKNFKEYMITLKQSLEETFLSMQEATESNNIEKVASLLEQVLSFNTELDFKQKPIIESVNKFCKVSDNPIFAVVSGIMYAEATTSIAESWNIINKLIQVMEKSFIRTMLMASEYFEAQDIEQKINLSKGLIVPEGVSIS